MPFFIKHCGLNQYISKSQFYMVLLHLLFVVKGLWQGGGTAQKDMRTPTDNNHETVVLQTKKPCDTVACVVTQVMGAGTKVRPGQVCRVLA
jgi:hypothetical protein